MGAVTRGLLLGLVVGALLAPALSLAQSREVCREVREDFRDACWRNAPYFRDGRYWDRDDYLRRHYPHHHHGDDDRLLEGVLIGAAVVGVTAAIVNAQDD